MLFFIFTQLDIVLLLRDDKSSRENDQHVKRSTHYGKSNSLFHLLYPGNVFAKKFEKMIPIIDSSIGHKK